MTQKEALDILKMGHNAFITGPAGSGKTHLLNEYINYLKNNDVEVGITAATGIAASHMCGQTIHAWSGLGIRDSLSPYDLESLEEKPYLWKRFERAKVLIIDEISMLHHFRLDLVEQILRSFKRNNLPFGGLQVIFCGDFFQLPPVSRMGEREALFAYHSESWKNLSPKICYLNEQHRQNDESFLEILNSIRENNVSSEIIKKLKTRFGKEPKEEEKPTKIYTHNANVDEENEKELQKLPGKVFEYEMTNKGQEFLATTLKKGCLSPEILRLKKNARVMFTKNNFEEGYVNGTQGIVTSCDSSGIMVRTTKGKIINVLPATWVIEEDGKIKAQIGQYPLRLAWAITVHKSQGMSLDCAQIDLSRAFENGMGYVALSRIRSLEGLFLAGLNDVALKMDEEVLDFDRQFSDRSLEHGEELRNMDLDIIKEKQGEFLNKISPHGKKIKKKKLTTYEITKKMLDEGKTLLEISVERDLNTGTILDHCEKIRLTNPEFDFSKLAKIISSARQNKIKEALIKGGKEGGKYLLSPAKNKLGAGFSFEDIRLVRLTID
ncbi:MAG: AAA ATPase [Parcubacteria group bacterium GW2011_GWF2_38_76]|nr:MAG: AAA ATPase [Parcubacteria group bacterium GW2011_GWF2_38_76]HBM45952.1 hypothetical protein [Patescibacteria group bacterium]